MNDITVGDNTYLFTKDIVKKYLIDNGYDGLSLDECGCGTNNLAPCRDGPYPECVAARAYILQEEEHIDDLCPR